MLKEILQKPTIHEKDELEYMVSTTKIIAKNYIFLDYHKLQTPILSCTFFPVTKVSDVNLYHKFWDKQSFSLRPKTTCAEQQPGKNYDLQH